MEVANRPGCYVWNAADSRLSSRLSGFSTFGTLSWTGDCDGGLAQGTGTFTAEYRSGSRDRLSGRLEEGRQNGPWVLVQLSRVGEEATRAEGPFVDGRRHGRWIERHPLAGVQEGSYVDGQRNGHWIIRYEHNGTSVEGRYVNGRRHGRWVTRRGNGHVEESAYVDGEERLPRVLRFPNGRVLELRNENGRRVWRRVR